MGGKNTSLQTTAFVEKGELKSEMDSNVGLYAYHHQSTKPLDYPGAQWFLVMSVYVVVVQYIFK